MDILQALQNQYTQNADLLGEFVMGPEANGAGGDLVPLVSEGVQVLSLSITLVSSTNRVYVKASIWGQRLFTPITAAVFRGTSCIDAKAQPVWGTYDCDDALTFAFLDEPGTAGPHLYTVRVGSQAYSEEAGDPFPFRLNGTDTFEGGERRFGGVSKCTLTLLEIG